jgi:sugar lactone lactonase YvrE
MNAPETVIGEDALVLPDHRDATGENPIWDAEAATWWWIDIPKGAIHRLDPATGTVRSVTLPMMIGALVLDRAGGAVAACVDGLYAVGGLDDPAGLTVRRLAAIAHPHDGMRFNDGRCDRQGRFRVSTMVQDIGLAVAAGRWYRFDGTGLADLDDAGYVVPNGSAFSPDGRTVYASDTHPSRRALFAYDYDVTTGTTSARRPFAALPDGAGRPDGATVDADGFYWICCLDAGRLLRYAPDGRLDHVYRLPMLKPTCCAFGGPDRRTLLVTSLSRGPADLETDPAGGRLLMFRPGPAGLPEPRFGG